MSFRRYLIQKSFRLKYYSKILIKTFISESEEVESITTIHKSADWYERECYDLFGISFLNHPDASGEIIRHCTG